MMIKPVARRKTHRVSDDGSKLTAWVAYVRLPDGTELLVSGMPRLTKAEAMAESAVKAERLNAL